MCACAPCKKQPVCGPSTSAEVAHGSGASADCDNNTAYVRCQCQLAGCHQVPGKRDARLSLEAAPLLDCSTHVHTHIRACRLKTI